MALDVVPDGVIVAFDVADNIIDELGVTERPDESFEVLEVLVLVAAVVLDDAIVELEDATA